MARVLLVLPTATYRASDFLDASRALDAEVVVASERRQAMSATMGDRALVVDLRRPEAAAEAIVARAQDKPLDAVVGADEQGVLVAALAAARLGLAHNPPEAVAATRDKTAMRGAFAAAGLRQPDYRVAGPDADVAQLAGEVGLPCVVKAVSLSASRGVIRADDPPAADAAAERVRAILAEAGEDPHAPLLVERYVPGVAVPAETLEAVSLYTAEAAAALGLVEGPIHAELRIDGDSVWMLELAARSIGGLCSRSLRFGMGVRLEELILRHALGLPLDDLGREAAASAVMMLPIPKAGVLKEVRGQAEARAVPGVTGLEISIAPGKAVRALPEADRYLGFLFARAKTPEQAERALRTAHGQLEIVIGEPSE